MSKNEERTFARMESEPGIIRWGAGRQWTIPSEAQHAYPETLPPRTDVVYRNHHHESAARSLEIRGGMTRRGFERLRKYHYYKAFVEPLPAAFRQSFAVTGGYVLARHADIYWNNKASIDQFIADGNKHLIPLHRWYPGMTTEEMRKHLGGALWRQFCGNTLTRNRAVIRWVDRVTYVHRHRELTALERTAIEHALKTPTTLLVHARGFYEHSTAIILWLAKHCKGYYGDYRYIEDMRIMVRDTVEMSSLQALNWGVKRMKREHDALAAALQKSRFVEYAWLANLPELVINGVLCKPIRNSEELYEEGKRMQHCVAGYGQRIQQRSYIVYSCGDSTVGLIMSASGTRYALVVEQEQALGNTPPANPVAAALLAEVCKHVL